MKKSSGFSKRFSRQAGFTMLETLLAATLGIAAILGLATAFVSVQQMQKRQNLLVQLSELKLQFLQVVNSPTAWANTVAGNASLACAAGWTPPGCLNMVGKSTPLVLYNKNNVVFYDAGNNINNVFNDNGSPCTNAEQCGVALVVAWTPKCNLPIDPLCQNPDISIDGTFHYSGSMSSINFSNFGFHGDRPMGGLPSVPCDSAFTGTCTQTVICTAAGWSCVGFTPAP